MYFIDEVADDPAGISNLARLMFNFEQGAHVHDWKTDTSDEERQGFLRVEVPNSTKKGPPVVVKYKSMLGNVYVTGSLARAKHNIARAFEELDSQRENQPTHEMIDISPHAHIIRKSQYKPVDKHHLKYRACTAFCYCSQYQKCTKTSTRRIFLTHDCGDRVHCGLYLVTNDTFGSLGGGFTWSFWPASQFLPMFEDVSDMGTLNTLVTSIVFRQRSKGLPPLAIKSPFYKLTLDMLGISTGETKLWPVDQTHYRRLQHVLPRRAPANRLRRRRGVVRAATMNMVLCREIWNGIGLVFIPSGKMRSALTLDDLSQNTINCGHFEAMGRKTVFKMGRWQDPAITAHTMTVTKNGPLASTSLSQQYYPSLDRPCKQCAYCSIPLHGTVYTLKLHNYPRHLLLLCRWCCGCLSDNLRQFVGVYGDIGCSKKENWDKLTVRHAHVASVDELALLKLIVTAQKVMLVYTCGTDLYFLVEHGNTKFILTNTPKEFPSLGDDSLLQHLPYRAITVLSLAILM